MICGGAIPMPAGFVKPAPAATSKGSLKVGCPICGRSKELEASSQGQTRPCWFCQAPLLVPDRDGVAALSLQAETPASPNATLAVPAADVTTEARLVWMLLQKIHKAGRLGAGTAEWVPRQLQKLVGWEKSGSAMRSPLDPKLTSSVLAHAVFKSPHPEEQVLDGKIVLSIPLSETTGTTQGQQALISTAIGLAALAVTGRGWVAVPTGEGEDERITTFLDFTLQETRGDTLVSYAVQTSTGNRLKPENVLGQDFASRLPALFARCARNLLAFKVLFGAALPARLWGYVTRESLNDQAAKLTDDKPFAADVADQLFRSAKS